MTLPVPLRHHADSDVVLFDTHDAWTLVELRRRALGVRERLAGLPGEHVVLACADRGHFCAALLAAWSLGLRVWLPHSVQADAVEALARTAGVRALLHDRDGGDGLDVRACGLAPDQPLTLALQPDDAAVVVHTSGSTGRPVAHEKTWQQLGAETAVLLRHFGLAGKRVLATVPPHHIYGLLFGVLVPLCGGGRVGRSSPLLPADVLKELSEGEAEVLVSVPAQLRTLEVHEVPRSVRIFSSGAPLSPTTAGQLRGRGCMLVEVLGSTETGGIAARTRDGAAWQPFPEAAVDIAEDGRLRVDSPWLAPDAPRPFVCADRVEPDGDGFRHLGRADRVVKLGGRRVDLGAVESELERVPGVRASRVIAVEARGLRGLQLLAAVEAQAVTAIELRAALCRRLDPVTVPRRYRIVNALPRGAAGKVSDAAVRALFEGPPTAPPIGHPLRVEVPATLWSADVEVSDDDTPEEVAERLTDLAEAEARAHWPELGPLAQAIHPELRQPPASGELVLSLTRPSPCEVAFVLRFGGEPAGSGQLLFQEAIR